MNFRKYIVLSLLITILSACSIPTDELSDAVGKKVEEEVGKAVDKATEEGKKKAEEVLASGVDKVDSALNELLGLEKDTQPLKKIETSGTTEQIPVEYVRGVDGDTIRIIYNNKEMPVRYLLVDSPEITNGKNQPFGKEAAERNKELLESGNVTIEFDVGERVDKYSRLLGYIYVDGVSVQETLIREGLVRVAYVYPPNTRHLDAYERAQDYAKKKEIGIWSIENYADNRFKQ